MVAKKLISLLYIASAAIFIIFAAGLMLVRTPATLPYKRYVIIIACVTFIPVFYTMIYFVQKFIKTIPKWLFYLLSTLIIIIPRFLYVLSVKSVPISDFEHIHDFATNASRGIYDSYFIQFPVFPFKFSYGFFLAIFYRIFGAEPFTAYILNIILSILLAFLLYKIGCMFTDEKNGRIIPLIFALWPAQIMYVNVVASEHGFMVFFVLSVYFFLYGSMACLPELHKRQTKPFFGICGRNICVFFLAGVSAGLAALIRPTGTVLLPVFVLASILYLFCKDVAYKGKLNKVLYKFIILIISFVLIFMGYVAGTKIPAVLAKPFVGVDISKSASGFNVMMGTNPSPYAPGMFNMEDMNRVFEKDYDFDRVHKEAMNIGIQRIKEDPVKFVTSLIPAKMLIMWCDEYYGYYWSTYEAEAKNFAGKFLLMNRNYVYLASQLFYIFLLLMIANGAVNAFRGKLYKISHIVPVIIFFAFFAAHIIFEVQSRYHYTAIAMMLIFIPLGFFERNRKNEPESV